MNLPNDVLKSIIKYRPLNIINYVNKEIPTLQIDYKKLYFKLYGKKKNNKNIDWKYEIIYREQLRTLLLMSGKNLKENNLKKVVKNKKEQVYNYDNIIQRSIMLKDIINAEQPGRKIEHMEGGEIYFKFNENVRKYLRTKLESYDFIIRYPFENKTETEYVHTFGIKNKDYKYVCTRCNGDIRFELNGKKIFTKDKNNYLYHLTKKYGDFSPHEFFIEENEIIKKILKEFSCKKIIVLLIMYNKFL